LLRTPISYSTLKIKAVICGFPRKWRIGKSSVITENISAQKGMKRRSSNDKYESTHYGEVRVAEEINN
jgi:hypothetical protein